MDTKQKRKVVIGVVVVLVLASFVIPMDYWSCKIVSGRYVSEARIVERSDDAIAVRLYNATANESKVETGTFLVLAGNVPSEAYVGQDIRIGYSFDGLYDNPDQKVQVAYREKGSVFDGFLLRILPFLGTGGVDNDLQIVDIQSDGTLLAYNKAS